MALKYEEIFKYFEEEIPNYYKSSSIRTSQIQMAMDIADFIQDDNTSEVMIIEAPVGTGKSLGALVPVLSEMRNKAFNKRSMLYATATINLQGQLMNSEVPLLKNLSLIRNSIVAKGKSHYYCHKKFLEKKEKFSPMEQTSLQDFFLSSKTGQRSELEDDSGVDLSESQWKQVELEASKRECERCELNKACQTSNHRKSFFAQNNDLMITNHDQLIASYLNIINDRSPIIPINQGIIVIDEAHHFLENFLGRLEDSFSLKAFRRIERLLQKKYKAAFKKHYHSISQAIQRSSCEIEGSLQGRYNIPESIISEFRAVNSLLHKSITDYEVSPQMGALWAEEELDSWSHSLEKFLEVDFVTWMDYETIKFSAISDSFPTDFKRMMDYLTRYNKVIIMSGTLTVDGDFESLINQWRLNGKRVTTKLFDTPFDYKNQSMIYVPEEISMPMDGGFIDSAYGTIKDLIYLTHGKTLMLNTSKEHMDTFSEKLEGVTKELDIQLFKQGTRGVEKLTKYFRQDEDSVLVGTGSFFSGFSIPGTSLTSVILNKLPFPVKDDPILELIGQGYEGGDFFDFISFPHMVNKLNQAIGRLIRGIEDYGIVTILDKRMFTSNRYGGAVQQLLASQGYTITRDWSEIEDFYKRKLEKGSEADYSSYSKDQITIPPALHRPMETNTPDKATHKVNTQKKKSKPRGVTRKQREFAKEICEQEGIPAVKARYPYQLYAGLVSALYYEWKDIQIVEDTFPFTDEKQKAQLTEFEPTDRKTYLPACKRFGCDGNCNIETQDDIKQSIEEKHNPDHVSFRKAGTHCWVQIYPATILQKDEFKPM